MTWEACTPGWQVAKPESHTGLHAESETPSAICTGRRMGFSPQTGETPFAQEQQCRGDGLQASGSVPEQEIGESIVCKMHQHLGPVDGAVQLQGWPHKDGVPVWLPSNPVLWTVIRGHLF